MKNSDDSAILLETSSMHCLHNSGRDANTLETWLRLCSPSISIWQTLVSSRIFSFFLPTTRVQFSSYYRMRMRSDSIRICSTNEPPLCEVTGARPLPVRGLDETARIMTISSFCSELTIWVLWSNKVKGVFFYKLFLLCLYSRQNERAWVQVCNDQ